MSSLRKAAQQALEALEGKRYTACGWRSDCDKAITALRAALAEPVQEPVAWSHNFIRDNIITHRPADLERHPERWTALYSEPQPCPTCEALARTVMLDQTSHDTAPPQRKPLTEEEIKRIDDSTHFHESPDWSLRFARAIEKAHGIKERA